MKSAELKRWLSRHGCTFQPAKGGHILVLLGQHKSVLPVHGAGKDLGTGLVERILKDLGLKERGVHVALPRHSRT